MLLTHTQILWLHASPALLALILGSVILASKKGTTTHKFRGYTWLGLMFVVGLSGIFIEEINPGSFTYVHLFIPYTILCMFLGIYYIKKYRATGDHGWIVAHQITMIGLFFGLLFAGYLTLLPGRMFQIF